MGSWLALGGAVLAYGTSALFQASGVRQSPAGLTFFRAALVFLRSWKYLLGTALDLGAVVLVAFALRDLPLFLVQAATAGSIVVTAIGSSILFPVDKRPRTGRAIVAVVGGLALAGSAASPGPSIVVDTRGALLLGLGFPLMAVVRLACDRLRVETHVKHGILAGLGYAGMGISLRVLHVPANAWLTLAEPAAIAAVCYLLLALYFFGRALRDGTVTQAMAMVVSFDSILPAAIGLLFLGDAARPGWIAAAVVGLAITVLGVMALIRTMPDDEPGPAAVTDPTPTEAALTG